MIIGSNFGVRARAPLRLGLAGGGTDLSPYCDETGGAILNVTIDRFAYAHVYESNHGAVVFRARDVAGEEVLERNLAFPINEGLMLHRAVYKRIMRDFCDGVALPITISTVVEVPAGSGLGASSALVVAMIEAFRTALDLPLGPYDVARLAFEIERIDLGLAGGRQDQYSAAFGGLNFIEFLPGDRVIVNPLRMRRDYLNEFESSLVICFTGQSRKSDAIIREQIAGLKTLDERTLLHMNQLKQDAGEMKLKLLQGQIREAALILNRSWQAKKATAAGVATDSVNKMFDAALNAGAWGGKISGAGGGGFLMLFTDPENRFRLISDLAECGGQASAVKFFYDGVEGWKTFAAAQPI